ncbi:kelch repeatcontaining protein [Acanthamoeba castellanii str. Neff]|uniref:Kelch repeatcontaining protein n=1 Tax=Acanthamoeba castellanii (strain ATCC 30010 / Neff) TaxID=1257118 RepID=L8HK57_ACACF|nr:kelch repeatcontaining protein [Acanthamoeba castellanii str. Neff]ELR25577.1 kelch repeatcontaining protein [Acanthamoeba castellanii str. Neff]
MAIRWLLYADDGVQVGASQPGAAMALQLPSRRPLLRARRMERQWRPGRFDLPRPQNAEMGSAQVQGDGAVLPQMAHDDATVQHQRPLLPLWRLQWRKDAPWRRLSSQHCRRQAVGAPRRLQGVRQRHLQRNRRSSHRRHELAPGVGACGWSNAAVCAQWPLGHTHRGRGHTRVRWLEAGLHPTGLLDRPTHDLRAAAEEHQMNSAQTYSSGRQ